MPTDHERIKYLEKTIRNLRIIGDGLEIAGNPHGGYVSNRPKCEPAGGAATSGPTGACCFESGNCTIISEDTCISFGGTYQGDGTDCDPNPCPQPPPTGACCVGTDCTIETESDCTGMGGTYQGDDTTCDPNPCATGACCKGEVCDIETQAACEGSGGVYQGDGTDCDPNTCTATGACCVTGNPCYITTESGCGSDGGHYFGNGTNCTGIDCTNPFCGVACSPGPDPDTGGCLLLGFDGQYSCRPASSCGEPGDCSVWCCTDTSTWGGGFHQCLDCQCFACSCEDLGSCDLGGGMCEDGVTIDQCFNDGGIGWLCGGTCP